MNKQKSVPGTVDLERLMGRWYVVACLPKPFERGLRDAVETYRLEPDGTIAATRSYRRKHPSGRPLSFSMRGFVEDRDSNAVWRMQLVWPFRTNLRVVAVDRAYTYAVIGRNCRKYARILSRTPEMPHRDFFAAVRALREHGYDADRLRRVPHAMPADRLSDTARLPRNRRAVARVSCA